MTHCVLSDSNIETELEKGNLLIHPFHKKNLSNCSYDVTLGPWFYRGPSETNKDRIWKPWISEEVEDYWGEPQYATTVTNNELGLTNGTQYILLKPNEFILACTNEFIGGINGITTMLKARSSIGRIGITICNDAGWGDISYYSRWCLEVRNSSQWTIPLIVGSRIGQIVFMYTGYTSNPYYKKGIYQSDDGKEIFKSEESFDKFVSSWQPHEMLPKVRL